MRKPIQYLLNIPQSNWFLSVSQERLKSLGNVEIWWRYGENNLILDISPSKKDIEKGKTKCIVVEYFFEVKG